MQIAGASEVKTNQDMMYVTKRDSAQAACALYTGRTDAAEEVTSKQEEETYQPSKEGLSMLASENLAKLQAAELSLESLENQENSNPYEDYTKAMRIAINMMRGKRVPPQDERFLIEFDSELYQAAKNVQMMKELKEDAESELEDEDEGNIAEKIRKLSLDGPGADQQDGSGGSTGDIQSVASASDTAVTA